MSKTIEINAGEISELDELIIAQDKDVEIRGAVIKDAFCQYTYSLLKGPTKGDVLSHNGSHIIHDDLQSKFERLNVFFAHLDDAYTGNKNSTSLEELEQEIETDNYSVTAFKMSGSDENKSVVLVGYKQVSAGVIKFETPKVKLSEDYLYLHPLKVRLYELIDEVDAYRLGKSAPSEDENQMYMEFSDEDEDFESRKLD